MNGNALEKHLALNGFTHQHGTFWNRQDGDNTATVTFQNGGAEFAIWTPEGRIVREVADYDRVAECVDLYV